MFIINHIATQVFLLGAAHTKGFAPRTLHEELPFLDQATFALRVHLKS